MFKWIEFDCDGTFIISFNYSKLAPTLLQK